VGPPSGGAHTELSLFGLKHLLKQAGDEVSAYVAEVCERELIARLCG
jgi:hypothetical protein